MSSRAIASPRSSRPYVSAVHRTHPASIHGRCQDMTRRAAASRARSRRCVMSGRSFRTNGNSLPSNLSDEARPIEKVDDRAS
jgi:hypothetical protein